MSPWSLVAGSLILGIGTATAIPAAPSMAGSSAAGFGSIGSGVLNAAMQEDYGPPFPGLDPDFSNRRNLATKVRALLDYVRRHRTTKGT